MGHIEVTDGVLGEDWNILTRSQVEALVLLPPAAMQLWLALAVEVGKTRRGWFVEGGMREIATIAHLSERSCWRALPQLERAGLVVVKTRKRARGCDAEHKYVVTRPAAAAALALPERKRKPGRPRKTAAQPDPQLQLVAGDAAQVFHKIPPKHDTAVIAAEHDTAVIADPPRAMTGVSEPQIPEDPSPTEVRSPATLPAVDNRSGGRLVRLDGRALDVTGCSSRQLVEVVERVRSRQIGRLQDGPQLTASEATPALAQSLRAFRGAAERWIDVRVLDLLSFLPCPPHVMLIALCSCGCAQTWAGSGDVCKRCGSGQLDVRRTEAAIAAGLYGEAQSWTEGALVPSATVLLDAAGVTRGRHRGILGRWLSERIGSAAAALDAGVTREAGAARAAWRNRG